MSRLKDLEDKVDRIKPNRLMTPKERATAHDFIAEMLGHPMVHEPFEALHNGPDSDGKCPLCKALTMHRRVRLETEGETPLGPLTDVISGRVYDEIPKMVLP